MDILNIVVCGENKSGKTTFSDALKLMKTCPYLVKIYEHNFDTNETDENFNIILNADIYFYIVDISEGIILKNLNQFANIIEKNNTCIVIPVFNKLDMHDFFHEYIGADVTLSNEDTQKFIEENIKIFLNVIGEKLSKNKIICSADYANSYLTLSKLNKKSTFGQHTKLATKIGEYELGKMQWIKKSSTEKSTFFTNAIEKIKKTNNLGNTLDTFGYNIQNILKIEVTKHIFHKIILKHLELFEITLENLIKTDNIVSTLKFITAHLYEESSENTLESLNIDKIQNLISDYLNFFDYTKIDFNQKKEVLEIFKQITEEEKYNFLKQNLSSTINNLILVLLEMLSIEVCFELEGCTTFVDLVDRLYECLDISAELNVEMILVSNKTFKDILFSHNIKKNMEYVFEKFIIDKNIFYTKVMEKQLEELEKNINNDINNNTNYNFGIFEHMCVILEYLNTINISTKVFMKYKIILRYLLSKVAHKCDKIALIAKIDDENTLYIAKEWCKSLCDENSSSDEVEQQSSEEISIESLSEKHKKDKN